MNHLQNVTAEALRIEAFVETQVAAGLAWGGALFGGGAEGQWWAGHLALGTLVLLTLFMFYYVSAQVWNVAVTLSKILGGLVLGTFAAIWAVKLYGILHGEVKREDAAAVADRLVTEASHAWTLAQWWHGNRDV